MSLLVMGAGGQVGRALCRAAERAGLAHRAFGHGELDVTDADAVRHVVARNAGSSGVVVNLAAWTDVDRAEAERDAAFRVNAYGAEVVADACTRANAFLVHLSTDYVFDGTAARAYVESDAPAPINVYGASKRAGEEAVRAGCARHLIVRTSWVFGPDGRNFLHTMRALAEHRDVVRVVADEIGCPTAADALARTLLHLARHAASARFDEWGTYHYCGRPPVSRADFARAIFAEAARHGAAIARVDEITSAEFAAPAPRPLHSVLDCTRIRRVFGVPQHDWRAELGAAFEARPRPR